MLEKRPLVDGFLQRLHEENVPISIFLINGIKLQGQLDAFDDQVVILKNNMLQLVFIHAISTIVPSKNLTLVG